MHTHANNTKSTRALKDSHRDCFACGVCNSGGLNIHFEVDLCGRASADWQPSGAFQSYSDRLHGGVVATLLDSAMVHALAAKGIRGVTAELTVRYLKSVGLKQPLQVTGWIESVRHGVCLCRADVHQGGRHAVRATAKFMDMDAG
jgi:acyl-coenzyme A thioesterase PaaI-like protein